ncbi:MAG: DNA-processing protein DprA, partial [Desulfovibrionaceae bacterium]|nr:DNA-processing protein DprA [Desulfovibrionaceae bacterium]
MSPDQSKEFFACLAVRHTPGIGPKTWKAVLEAFDGAYQAVQAAGSWLGRGLVNKGQARAFQDQSWRPAAEQEYRAARAKGMAVLTWSDPDYPDRLRHIPDPPVFLYYCGDLSLLLNPCLAVVGARHCSGQGLEAAARISAELSAVGLTIVSGMACGIDRQAHLAGLSGIGRSIGVLGAGLDVNYPAGNADLRRDMEEKGLVVTEFGPGIRPEAGNFPFRNRIISGLSLGVLVAEAAERSGSLITARLAGDQGREVFALPGPAGRPESGGCNRP